MRRILEHPQRPVNREFLPLFSILPEFASRLDLTNVRLGQGFRAQAHPESGC